MFLVDTLDSLEASRVCSVPVIILFECHLLNHIGRATQSTSTSTSKAAHPATDLELEQRPENQCQRLAAAQPKDSINHNGEE